MSAASARVGGRTPPADPLPGRSPMAEQPPDTPVRAAEGGRSDRLLSARHQHARPNRPAARGLGARPCSSRASWVWPWERGQTALEAVLDVLTELAAEKWVSVEYGVQSIHQNSLQWLQRGHDFTCCESAINRTLSRGLNVAVHLILGLPGESRDEMNATAEAMARLRVNTVKLHNLHVVRDTPLATLWQAGGVRLPSLEGYAAEVVDFLERLPPDCVIDRLSGDAPSEFFIAPQWSQDKLAVRRAVEGEFARRGTRQGSRWVG